MSKKSLSFYLFSKPSFRLGLARLWDFGHALSRYNTSKTDKMADTRALAADWVMVGRDMKEAIQSYERRR